MGHFKSLGLTSGTGLLDRSEIIGVYSSPKVLRETGRNPNPGEMESPVEI